MIGPGEVTRLRDTLVGGGVAVVPTDTVYGVAAALDVPAGVEGLYALKGRPRSQPCQVLCYAPELVAEALAPVPDVAAIVRALVPGTVTCIVPDPAGRFDAASGASAGSVGLRVPHMTAAFQRLELFLVATSANDPGAPDPATVEAVPARILAGVATTLDAGTLPGTASSVVDLRTVAHGRAVLLRPGPDEDALIARLRRLGLDVTVAT